MNAAQLLTHFDRISEATDAIPRLRGFILDLAVRGKLVEQEAQDQPASELLKSIKREKTRLVPARELARQDLEELSPGEAPFEVPCNWVWTTLGEICSKTGSGSTPRGGKSVYRDCGIPFLRSQNVYDDGLRLDDVAYIDQQTHERMAGTVVRPGDLLLNITGGSMGRCCRIPDDFIEANISQHVAIIRVALPGLQDFLHRLTLSPYFQSFIFNEQTGAGRGGLPKNKMDRIPVALSPLAEQRRIVAKVDELMVLCDRLEAAQTERERRRDQLTAASLNRLNHPDSADTTMSREHARFHLRHLPQMTARPDQIPQLRQTILDLAVRGRLVPQDPKDEPASALLKHNAATKEQLIQQAVIRKEKALQPIRASEAPFSIPTNWSWCRIGTSALLTEYGTSVKSDDCEQGVPVLKMGNIQNGRVLLGAQKKVPRNIDDLPHLFLKRFDLLYNRTNSADLVGKTGIYLGDDDAYTFASYLIRIRFLNEMMNPLYANLAMNSPYFRATQILPQLQQQCGQANVNGTKLRNMLLPVPPLTEQHRIVARVQDLLALCDHLEVQLTAARAESSRLLEAVLQKALSPDSWRPHDDL